MLTQYHDDHILTYIVLSIIIYFYLKNILSVLIIYVLWIGVIHLFHTSTAMLQGSALGVFLGLLVSLSLFKLAKLCKKKTRLVSRYLLQCLIVLVIFAISDIEERVPGTNFGIGVARTYIAVILLLFIYCYVNRQTEKQVKRIWRDVDEYDDAHIYLFLIVSAYMIPFMYIHKYIELTCIFITVCIEIVMCVVYNVSWRNIDIM